MRGTAHAFRKRSQALVECCRIIEERRVPGVRHDVDLRVRDGCSVPIDNRRFDDCVGCAMRDQYRLANLRQEVVIVEGAREQSLPAAE